jgi:hypothetical protein
MRVNAVPPPDPSWAAFRAHSGRLFRRARRHVSLVFGLVALATLGALGLAALRPVRQSATVVLRMTEDVKAPMRLAWNDRALRGYVSEVAFSQTQLLGVIERNRMFRNMPGRFDPILAVELLRERITVEVVQNHAIALVERDNRPRSAHVRIRYEDGDPARAVRVARELGELVVATGRGQQRQQTETSAALARADRDAARGALERLRLQATSSADFMAVPVRSLAEMPGLGDSVRQAQARLDRAEETLAQAERRLRGDADTDGSAESGGLHIQLVDTIPAPPPWPVGKKLAVVAAAASVFCFPLAALMVGAWDRRIYAAEDVRLLGVRCLGHLGLQPHMPTGMEDQS